MTFAGPTFRSGAAALPLVAPTLGSGVTPPFALGPTFRFCAQRSGETRRSRAKVVRSGVRPTGAPR